MNKNKIIEAFGLLDEKFVEEANPENAKKMHRLRKRLILRFSALAACFCFVLALSARLAGNLFHLPVPTYENAVYSAEYIGGLFDIKNDYATSSYQTFCLPPKYSPCLKPVPQEQYFSIYNASDTKKWLSRIEFSAFADPIISRFASAAGEEAFEYYVSKSSRGYLNIELKKIKKYFLNASQNEYYNYIIFTSSRHENPEMTITLDGTKITADQTKTDEEILASFEKTKESLFRIFGKEFKNAKIIREYDEYSSHGVTFLRIYFYNENEHELNSILETPVSDHICISFDNSLNWNGDIVSDDILSVADVYYRQNRTKAQNTITETKKLKAISLADAEALLYKGYVFGGHSCPICMAQQNKVDFHSYDFVGFTYLNGYDENGKATEYFPFYEFCKKIGTANNGNTIYARTYVPAIELYGYEEYFKGLESEHK